MLCWHCRLREHKSDPELAAPVPTKLSRNNHMILFILKYCIILKKQCIRIKKKKTYAASSTSERYYPNVWRPSQHSWPSHSCQPSVPLPLKKNILKFHSRSLAAFIHSKISMTKEVHQHLVHAPLSDNYTDTNSNRQTGPRVNYHSDIGV